MPSQLAVCSTSGTTCGTFQRPITAPSLSRATSTTASTGAAAWITYIRPGGTAAPWNARGAGTPSSTDGAPPASRSGCAAASTIGAGDADARPSRSTTATKPAGAPSGTVTSIDVLRRTDGGADTSSP